jgi:hypothetical protein
MSCRCGCCEGIEKLTPASVENRPGLPHLSYRVGTHATFLASMEAALSSAELDGEPNPLRGLTTRDPADFSLALLDAWATVADVLSFYQERLANEGYLRTATERLSILELAKLIGYKLRPGVAASAFLALTLEDGHELSIPRGSPAQSVPGAGELPQTFETSEDLEARAEWNVIRPRTTIPQAPALDGLLPENELSIYLAGLPSISVGAFVLLVTNPRLPCRVTSVAPQAEANRTKIVVKPVTGEASEENLIAVVRRITEAALREDVATQTAIGKRVAAVLRKVIHATQGDAGGLAKVLTDEFLPQLRLEAKKAKPFARLGPWVGSIVEGLTRAATRLAEPAQDGHLTIDETGSELPSLAMKKGPNGPGDAFPSLQRLLSRLIEPPSIPPRNRFVLRRSVESLSAPNDASVRVATAFFPQLQPKLLYRAWGRTAEKPADFSVQLLKLTAGPYGQNALRRPTIDDGGQLEPQSEWDEWTPADDEEGDLVYLEGEHPEITPSGYAVIQRPDDFDPQVFTVIGATIRGRSEYGLTGKATVLTLDRPWWSPVKESGPILAVNNGGDTFDVIRRTVVHTASEQLELAEAPLDVQVQGDEIDLDGVYDSLLPGRWLIVTGERILDPAGAAISARRLERARREFVRAGAPVPGDAVPAKAELPTVPAAELVMLSGAEQRLGVVPGRSTKLAGDKPRTWLRLARALAYEYVRESVRIYANVIDSTHGETRREVLGSGDASKSLQRFQLKAKPLTHVSAETPDGEASTLDVRVDEVLWHEAPGRAAMGPRDRKYLTETADDGTTTVVFGDGRRGERLPTGIENVAAVYRTGIGKGGNLDSDRITQLASKPLGLKGVTNPLPATGGADPDSRDAARRNAPLSVTALDRLVSLRDYEDFTRLFAGIGKASAVELSDGRRRLVHVTIAGVDDIPISPTSDLFAKLGRSLRTFGDPHLPVVVATRELLLLVIAAKVRVQPDYLWELVEPKVRVAVAEAFAFDRRELGQSVAASEVVATIQAVPGVGLVDLDVLNSVGLPGSKRPDPDGPGGLGLRQRVRAELARVQAVESGSLVAVTALPGFPRPKLATSERRRARRILPAQLAILKADVPETLLLSELPR